MKLFTFYLLFLLLIVNIISSNSFIIPRCSTSRLFNGKLKSLNRHYYRTEYDDYIKEEPILLTDIREFDNLHLHSFTNENQFPFSLKTFIVAVALMLGIPSISWADSASSLKAMFDPSQFQPVCPSSDLLYQLLKSLAYSLIGDDNVVEYGPLIASVLLRIRLEVCVLESFIYEAVVPFVQQKGFSWILPLHESIETVLAGTIFAIASNFILLGSTKIITVLFVYSDALTGLPARWIGKLVKKVSPSTNKGGQMLGNIITFYGELSKTLRQFIENTDTFVGRYLVVFTSVYIIFKIAHFKLFNDIFP